MTSRPTAKLRIGAWCVDPTAGQISRGGEVVRVEARTMRLLLDLAQHAGEVVSIDALLDRVWAGVIVTPDSVYQAVASLRRLLGDDPRRPSYIATVPRLGYRMVAAVGAWTEPTAAAQAGPRPGRRTLLAAGGLAAIALVAVFAAYTQVARARHTAAAAVARLPIAAVGVLPFLDLTPTMDQEPLTDNVTEGLIDQLGKNTALRTPGFRSSFLLKGKHATPAEAARTLGVSYVVDGSVRKAGDRVRIAARLLRADNGFVIWSQTYDRPLAEIPAVEDAIAAGVAKALAAAQAPKG
jgi:TolB-like protein/DNA-binding winged helix-turn-helix (wHTH) protein